MSGKKLFAKNLARKFESHDSENLSAITLRAGHKRKKNLKASQIKITFLSSSVRLYFFAKSLQKKSLSLMTKKIL
jgi:hypothetical protein